MKSKSFREVLMRDTLPTSSWGKECGVINLDVSRNDSTN